MIVPTEQLPSYRLPPKICSACVWPCALVSLLSMTGIFSGLSPSMLSSFDFQYTVAIVARHLIFRSPLLKCFVRRRNSRPSTAVSRPSRSTSVMWGPLKYCVSTCTRPKNSKREREEKKERKKKETYIKVSASSRAGGVPACLEGVSQICNSTLDERGRTSQVKLRLRWPCDRVGLHSRDCGVS